MNYEHNVRMIFIIKILLYFILIYFYILEKVFRVRFCNIPYLEYQMYMPVLEHFPY